MTITDTFTPGRWASAIQDLTEYLMAAAPGEIVGYNTMSEICAETVGSTSYPVQASLKRALREGASFTCVPTVGYRRNDDRGSVDKAAKTLPSALRKLRKGKLNINTADPHRLKGEDQRRFYATDARIHEAMKTLRKRKVDVPQRTSILSGVQAEFQRKAPQ